MSVNFASHAEGGLERRVTNSQNNGLNNDSKKLDVFPIVKIVFRSLTSDQDTKCGPLLMLGSGLGLLFAN